MKEYISHILLAVIFLICLPFYSINAIQPTEEPPIFLDAVAFNYKKISFLQMSVTKKLAQPLLKKERVSRGTIFLSKKKFRIEFSQPEKELLVYDGKVFWSIKHPPVGMEDLPIQVAKTPVKNIDKSKVLFSLLMGEDKILKNFEILSSQELNSHYVYEFKPKDKGFEFDKLEIYFDKNSKFITSISYRDSVNNLTEWKFSNIDPKTNLSASLFSYKPPKNAEVSTITR